MKKLIGITNKPEETVINLRDKRQYADFATKQVKKALWDRVWEVLQPDISHKPIPEREKICAAVCKQLEIQAFKIFKKK